MNNVRKFLVRIRKIAPEQYVLALLLLVAVLLWLLVYLQSPRPLAVIAFTVGKGDALLLRGPAGETVLLDGGSSDIPQLGERYLVPSLLLNHISSLDAIIITHPDSDHINALPAVLDAMPVKRIFSNGQSNESSVFQLMVLLAKRKGIPWVNLREGDRLHLGNEVTLNVLAPTIATLTAFPTDTNNNSVVCALHYRQTSMLFTGDIAATGEETLLASGEPLQVDILKVPHHGSRFGSSNAFLTAVAPKMAVISCPGGEQGEHPSKDTVARLRAHNIDVLRTDVAGEIYLTSNGTRWQVHTYR